MRHDDYADDDSGPVVSKKQLPMPSNFVQPLARREQPQTIDAPTWLVSREPTGVSAAWEPQHGSREATSAQDRAQALRTRLQPFLWAWGGVGVVLGVTVYLVAGSIPGGALLAVLAFALLTAVTYTRLNTTDYQYSREGTERHRVDTAADLAREQMRHEQELRKMALESYLKQLDGKR